MLAQLHLWWIDRRKPKLDGLPQQIVDWFVFDGNVHLVML